MSRATRSPPRCYCPPSLSGSRPAGSALSRDWLDAGGSGPPGKSRAARTCYALRTLVACRPLGPRVTSNSTLSPSASDLKPEPAIALKCTNTSSPPSCVMNPNPLASLNHFTFPLAMLQYLPLGFSPCVCSRPRARSASVSRQIKNAARTGSRAASHERPAPNQKQGEHSTDWEFCTCDSLRDASRNPPPARHQWRSDDEHG